MNRALIALAAVLAALAVSIPGAFGRTLEAAAPTATPGVTTSTITIGGTFPLTGPASLVRADPDGHEGVLQLRQPRARGPTASAASTAGRSSGSTTTTATTRPTRSSCTRQAGRAGQGLRDRRHARHRAQPGRPAVPEPAEGAADPRLDRRERVGPAVQAVPVDDRLAARLHRRGSSLRALASRRTRRTRRSRSSTRTTTTARTTSTASRSALGAQEEPDRRGAGLRGHGHELRARSSHG